MPETTLNSLQDLLVDELREIHRMKLQVVRLLPRMMGTAQAPELVHALSNHLVETEYQVARLEQVFDRLELSPDGKKHKGVDGVLERGREVLQAHGSGPVLDAALISAAQRMAHYAMAAYRAARSYAEMLGETEIAAELDLSYQEELTTDRLLNVIALQKVYARALAQAAGEVDVVKS